MRLNGATQQVIEYCIEHASRLRLVTQPMSCGTTIIDFGVKTQGGLEAGLLLSRICLADQASVSLAPADSNIWPTPLVQVWTDRPVIACMASQYAGWPVKYQKFFAMGSGPMRSCRGREHLLERLGLVEREAAAVGVLEADKLPDDKVCQYIAEECQVPTEKLTLCVAPTRSLAGTLQVVARSVETCLHKLFELDVDLSAIVAAHGSAPLPPSSRDFGIAIGRTNDAILYGGRVTLWIEEDSIDWNSIGPKIPSSASKDWGRPFAEVFRDYDYDFYKVDPGLFSPAQVLIHNLKTGTSHHFGTHRPDVLQSSFGQQ